MIMVSTCTSETVLNHKSSAKSPLVPLFSKADTHGDRGNFYLFSKEEAHGGERMA
jgi:hypothetical protein